MKKTALLIAGLLACAAANAQIYRCTHGGKTTYSQTPCTSGTSKIVNTRPNTIDTSMDWQRNQRYIQQRQMQQQMQQRQWQPPIAHHAPNRHNASAECNLAIRNANIQSGSARPEKIDNDRAAAIQACGFNPWPGPSMAEIDAQNQQARAIEEHARRQQAMAASEEARRRNPTLTNCDQGGCWGTDGTRYNRGAGNTFFSSKGGTCTAINGNQLHCP
ncbi:MAG: DUF4124 domain-containing protein [Pseudomonadota bacterium]|nr:DUF4124 domain-containing protein [Pseudomonadota bacterium]